MASVSPSPLIKEETRADSPSPTMHGREVSFHQIVNHPALKQPPLVSAPYQGDLWHLPGRLRINPSLWDKEDVVHWLHWAQKEYSLRRPEKGRFEMNGRALCLLTKEDFRRRCPSSGDVLYEILQCVKQHRRSVVCQPPDVSAPSGHIQAPVSSQIPSHFVQDPQAVKVSGCSAVSLTVAAAAPTADAAVNCQPEPISPLREQPVFHPYSASHTHNNRSAAVSTSPQNQIQSLPLKESVIPEPLNLSSRERPRSPLQKANGRLPECRLLWDYVYQLLCDDRYQDYIRWEDPDTHVFRVVDPNGLARLWGNHKNRDNMTYEKMSRALRHYYKLNIIKKERGQKLLFRFLKLPQDIRKHQVDSAGSPEHTPPQVVDFADSSPLQDFSDDHFEVSPDRASPQPPSTGAPVG
ncbi:transcription factor ETV7 isoform X1 [Cyprinodon tularosa]|uniref:transcription factor ETV7 isoform X1 n=1 Tax=Cyprinodon tularosa TaxID=77115 RepID=UPI0018E1FB9C|nr:transcription factor ETV7 isoform X1 [Cyprinodon tularosa]